VGDEWIGGRRVLSPLCHPYSLLPLLHDTAEMSPYFQKERSPRLLYLITSQPGKIFFVKPYPHLKGFHKPSILLFYLCEQQQQNKVNRSNRPCDKGLLNLTVIVTGDENNNFFIISISPSLNKQVRPKHRRVHLLLFQTVMWVYYIPCLSILQMSRVSLRLGRCLMGQLTGCEHDVAHLL